MNDLQMQQSFTALQQQLQAAGIAEQSRQLAAQQTQQYQQLTAGLTAAAVQSYGAEIYKPTGSHHTIPKHHKVKQPKPATAAAKPVRVEEPKDDDDGLVRYVSARLQLDPATRTSMNRQHVHSYHERGS